MPLTDSKPISNTDLARNKPEALVNILIVYSKKIHSCQTATATATRTAEKAIGLIRKKKRYLCPSSTLFCTFYFFAVFLPDYVLTCTFYSFYGGNSVCAELFLTCSRLFLSLLLFSFLFFFSLPLIITLVAAYFLTAPRENCHVLLPTKYMIPLRFLSLALALSSVINVNVDIRTYLVEEKTRICCCCCCCCFFPLKVRVAMRFTAKTRGCLKCKNSPWLT